jgi:RHS repeat-associated protein
LTLQDGNKVYFYHFDQVGSTLALTDKNAQITDLWAYDPYGSVLERTGENAQPFTFGGAWGVRQEGKAGILYQMQARYYDAVTGRFLSPEPIWPQPLDPKAVNPYQYAGFDPVRFNDPTGLTKKDVARTVAGLLTNDAVGACC